MPPRLLPSVPFSLSGIKVVEDDGDLEFVGCYQGIRKRLDYAYHPNYHPDRQLFQDELVGQLLDKVEPNPKPWIIFTAGAMGAGVCIFLQPLSHLLAFAAGKGYVMKHLTNERVIDLTDYGLIDPDAIKYQLPEMDGYPAPPPLLSLSSAPLFLPVLPLLTPSVSPPLLPSLRPLCFARLLP